MNGLVVWLTGLPGSGKTTIACEVLQALRARGRLACLLDGDALRRGVSSDIGFDREGRREAVRRAVEIAALLGEQDFVVLVALVSPYRADRDAARARVPEGRFIEVHVDAPLETCQARDPKGHYERARVGHLSQFTGVDAPYEAPLAPELHLLTADTTVGECASDLLRHISCTPAAGPAEKPATVPEQ